MQKELAAGRSERVTALLGGDHLAVPPRGVRYPRVWALTVYLGGLFVFNYVGVNHLFGALSDDPFKGLFMSLVLLRVTIWLVLPACCLWWYAGCLADLKRECLALRSLGR